MFAPITVNVDLPTDDADVLGGTLLDPVPGPGLLLIFVASTQRDGILTVTGPLAAGGGYKSAPVLRANGMPDLQSDTPFIVPTQGGKVFIEYDEVTAADAFATIMFVSG